MLRARKLGDLFTAVPALRALADAFPDHRRVLACPAWLAPLVAHLDLAGEVLGHPGAGPLPRSVHRADVAVDLHGTAPISQAVLLATQPRRLVAFADPALPGSWEGPAWRAGEHEVHRWCRLLAESGIPADASRLEVTPPPVPVPECALGATVVHPGAACEARRWPLERYATVIRAELATGHSVVVTGSMGERSLALRLAAMAGLPDEHVLAGRTDVLELVAVVGHAGRLVCGDTGVGHIATATGTPSVLLFGPVPPDEWGPPTGHDRHRALWVGRRGDPQGDRCDPGLLEIGVDDVLAALAALPDRTAAPAPLQATA